jgi:hypothetical protein
VTMGRRSPMERERERRRRSSGFSQMAQLGGRAAEMVTRRRLTKAVDAAPMERDWSRGGCGG